MSADERGRLPVRRGEQILDRRGNYAAYASNGRAASLVRTAELIGIAQDGEMAGDNLGVGRQHVVRIEQRVGIKAPDMAVKDVKIAKSKEVVAGYIVGMDVAERRAQIAQFVGMIGIGGDAGPPSRQRLIVG